MVTKIEWTSHTWNPTTGCTKISPGCQNCYAEIFANRLKMMKIKEYENGFNFTMHRHKLNQPLQRKKPTIYFVNSMSDLFHLDVSDFFLDRVFDTILKTPHHTYQILTKRSARMMQYFSRRSCPPNAWLGVTVEKASSKERIAHLATIEAPVRFVSFEPLLEYLGNLNLDGIGWVIVGGESGNRARPMLPQWVNPIKDQCLAEDIPFFFKQWGSWGPDGVKRSKKNNGRILNGKIYDGMPAVGGRIFL